MRLADGGGDAGAGGGCGGPCSSDEPSEEDESQSGIGSTTSLRSLGSIYYRGKVVKDAGAAATAARAVPVLRPHYLERCLRAAWPRFGFRFSSVVESGRASPPPHTA